MKQQITNSISSFAIASGNMDFFHFLQERSAEKFSHFEAYVYMLDKACGLYRPQNIEPKWIPTLQCGQFFITKTQLANDWHWHRATVRGFLAKLVEHGQLVMQEYLKGTLCTMTHLISSVNPNVAVVYNFDAMAKYTMYNWANDNLEPKQVAEIAGQIERSAEIMLFGQNLTSYSEKKLEDTTQMLLHYALQAIVAGHTGEIESMKEIGSRITIMDKRLYELFTGYLAGSWMIILSLLKYKTELAVNLLAETIQLDDDDCASIFEQLRQEALKLPDVNIDTISETASDVHKGRKSKTDSPSPIDDSKASCGLNLAEKGSEHK